MIVVGVGCSSCGQSVGNDLATTVETSVSDIVAVDESENTENKDTSDTSLSDIVNSVVHDEETAVADTSNHETEIPETVPDKKGLEKETTASVEVSSTKEEETTEAPAEKFVLLQILRRKNQRKMSWMTNLLHMIRIMLFHWQSKRPRHMEKYLSGRILTGCLQKER